MDTSGQLPLWRISMDNLWSDMSLFDSDIEGGARSASLQKFWTSLIRDSYKNHFFI